MEFQETSVVRVDEFVVVTFQGEGGEEIAVKARLEADHPLEAEQCVEKACVLLTQAVNCQFPNDPSVDESNSPSHRASDLRQALESPAVQSYQAEKRKRRDRDRNEIEAELNDGLKASFPASDPVSPTTSVTAGRAPDH